MKTMKIATIPTHSKAAKNKTDPYLYGWREVQRTEDCGEVKWVREPLTLEDILHPQVGDYRMHSEEHERFCTYLYNVLTAHVANDPNAVVLHDVRVAWAHPDIKAHGPDIAVIFNVQSQRNWSTFDEREEATKPSLIIEITSPSTRSTDLENKVNEYARVGVPLYAIVDIIQEGDVPKRRLLGYRLTQDGYVGVDLDERGWLWLEPVRLWLGLRGENIACYDEAGHLIEDYIAMMTARTEAEARATEAEERVRQLEAELRRLRREESE
jgi:Uma2 family endonuclease